MADTNSLTANKHLERRRCFRISDMVGLKLALLPHDRVREVMEDFGPEQKRFNLLSSLCLQREQQRPLLSKIRVKHPEIAEYLSLLENKIDQLAETISAEAYTLPNKPTHEISLSAQGMRLFHEACFDVGTVLQIRLKLFPSGIEILIYGSVLSCEEDGHKSPHRPFEIAVDFMHLTEGDKEVLSKHVHQAQFQQIGPEPA